MQRDADWVATSLREEGSAVLLRGLVGGLAAAVVGGLAWGLTVSATDYEIGFLAWGIGLLAGAAVVAASGGERGRSLQAVAVLCGALGIVLGKYLAFVDVLKDVVRAEFGAAAAAEVSVFSSRVISFFVEELGVVFSGYDLLWVGLAVVTAWRIPRPGPGVASR